MYMVIAPPKSSPIKKRTIKKLDPIGSCSQTFQQSQLLDNYLFAELILDITGPTRH